MNPQEHRNPEQYRALFEGSQASLADMAARQAHALGRVGRLRSAIVSVLRKNFMELSAQAEANLGGRLSEVDDEILLAYLDAFTAAASRGDQRATIQALREAVTALGVPLRGEEPLLWVEQIHRHRQQLDTRRGVEPVPATAEPAATTPAVMKPAQPVSTTDPRSAPDGGGQDGPGGGAPLPLEDYWQWDDTPALQDLFADAEDALGATGPADVEEPVRWGSDLGAVSPTPDRWSPSPLQALDTPRPGPAPAPAVAPEELHEESGARRDEPENTAATTATNTATTEPDTATNADTEPPAQRPPAETAPAATARPVKKTAAKRQPRRRAEPPADGPLERAVPDAAATGVTTPAPGGPSLTDVFAEAIAADTRAGTQDASAPASVARVPVAADTAGAATGAPFRPELFPGGGGKPKRGRGTRTKAQAPVAFDDLPLIDQDAPTELNDGMRQALLAAASIPRPVFTRDLIGVAGSAAVVDAWEAECRADLTNSPVRFVAPKSRHRLRGRLVAVEPETVRPTDWWYEAVRRYRAGRLYELAVLLHRVGDEIVSFTLEEQLAVFRLNTPRGLVGVIVLLDTRLDRESPTLVVLREQMERILSERLTLVAVLTTSAEPGSLEAVMGGLEMLAQQHAWQPTAPVVAARSWEYADDRGSSAVMVLGQT